MLHFYAPEKLKKLTHIEVHIKARRKMDTHINTPIKCMQMYMKRKCLLL